MYKASEIPRHDPSAIAGYVEMVFGYLEGFVPVRMFAEKGTPDQRPFVRFLPINDAAAELQRLAPAAATRSQGLFVIPGTTIQTRSAEAKDIVQTGVLVIDLDAGDIAAERDKLISHIGPPTFEVASGGRTTAGVQKRHLYWRLTEAATGDDLERVRLLRTQIAWKCGGDRSFASMHQPIRVPGSIHGKNGQFAPVGILSSSEREYELDDLEAAVGAIPDPWPDPTAPRAEREPRRLSTAQMATIVVHEDGVDGITRFDALSRVIGHWVRNVRLGHATPDEAWQAVCDHNTAMIRPPWDHGKLRREFEAITRKDAASHGAPAGAARGPAANTAIPDQSDDAIAADFVESEGQDWRFVPAWNKWLRWQRTHWAIDEINFIRERGRQACRRAALSLRDKKPEARRIASNKTISAVVAIAGADPKVSRAPGAWDDHPMLLNTPAGTIDLATGECLSHDRELAITQITNASPGGDCHHWRTFLERITGGDSELEGYLQRLSGYCLTGRNDEQVFAFLHGSGSNGKSVFLNTIGHALGTYTATAALGTFTLSKSDRHLTELAGLRAARLVQVSETEAGRAWDEARIKTITGGERIRANFMRQDHFEFTPQFKLLVAGNHRPSLHGVGEAMRRRLHLVPFDVTIPEIQRDKGLTDKLRSEAGGILSWMLRGCTDWQSRGLQPPERVVAASQHYFEDEDVVGQWIDECCVRAAAASATSKSLFENWSAWADAAGQPTGTMKSLGEALRERGHTQTKVRGARGWHGIGLRHRSHATEDAA